ncbi:MAG: hypothetical protein K9G62_08695 [Alphaproteobacteria bacterium]|nr:hypothetical protein [Alphaproteobacteria bacterium]
MTTLTDKFKAFYEDCAPLPLSVEDLQGKNVTVIPSGVSPDTTGIFSYDVIGGVVIDKGKRNQVAFTGAATIKKIVLAP